MGIASVVAGTSGAEVSVAPPEQAETNMLRTRNPAAPRFMIGVCHGSRSALLPEFPRPPLRLFKIGETLARA